jgi:hypothetical protein
MTNEKPPVDVSGREKHEAPVVRCLALLALALLTGTAASADWIVTTDGIRVQTLGPWTVEGRLVVFERPDGSLASMALRDVDLDASEEATRAAQRPPEPAPPAAAVIEAVLVLTDDDVLHADPGEWVDDPAQESADTDEAFGEAADGPEGSSPSRAGSPSRLAVTDWGRAANAADDGLTITGTIANTSEDAAADIRVTLRLLDREGGELESVRAVLSDTTLLPGQTTRFRAEAVGVFDFDDLVFEASSYGLKTRSDSDSEEPDAPEPDAEEPGSADGVP